MKLALESDPLNSDTPSPIPPHSPVTTSSISRFLTSRPSLQSSFQVNTSEQLEFSTDQPDETGEPSGSLHDLNSSMISSPNNSGLTNILTIMASMANGSENDAPHANRNDHSRRSILGMPFISKGMPESFMAINELDTNSECKPKKSSLTDEMLKKRDFVIKLAKSLALYGAPTHKLEFHLSGISQALGVSSSFFILPGMILISYGQEDHSSSTHLVQTVSGYNMGQLSDVNYLCHEICGQKMHIDDATIALDKIRSRKRPDGFLGHPFFESTLCYLLMVPMHSFLLCLVGFRGKLFEALVAGIISIVVGGFILLSKKMPSFLFVLDFMSAFVVCTLTRTVQWIVSKESGFDLVYGNGNCFNYVTVSIAAVALLLPGLGLTFSVVEISSKNIISGTTRLLGAFFTAVMLGFGMSHGTSIVTFNQLPVLGGSSSACEIAPNPLWVILLFPLLSLNIDYLFKANLRQYPIMLLTCIVGYGTASFFYTFLPQAGGQVPISTAAFFVGLVSYSYSRMTNDIAIAPILSGIILLVPGSMGVKSSLLVLGSNIGSGTSVAFQMIAVAMSITIGLFLSSLVVWPTRRKDRFEVV